MIGKVRGITNSKNMSGPTEVATPAQLLQFASLRSCASARSGGSLKAIPTYLRR